MDESFFIEILIANYINNCPEPIWNLCNVNKKY